MRDSLPVWAVSILVLVAPLLISASIGHIDIADIAQHQDNQELARLRTLPQLSGGPDRPRSLAVEKAINLASLNALAWGDAFGKLHKRGPPIGVSCSPAGPRGSRCTVHWMWEQRASVGCPTYDHGLCVPQEPDLQ